jgi:hypothetical protein
MPGLQGLLVDRDGIPPSEARSPVKRIDAVFRVSPFATSRHRVGESALEGDQWRR